MKRILAALLLTGCGSYDSTEPSREIAAHEAPTSPVMSPSGDCGRTFYATPGFSPEQHAALRRVVARWNTIAIEQFCIEPGTSDVRTVTLLPYRSPFWYELSEASGGGDILGGHWVGSDNIVVVTGLSLETFELVALQEFGHAHGLDHTEAPSIMHSGVGTAKDFTEIDLRECRRVGACASDDTDGVVF